MCTHEFMCFDIYTYTETSITGPEDLTVIMGIGNELYSALSRLSKQSNLLLTELPDMVIVIDTDYQLEVSESYTDNLHAVSVDGNVPYVTPFCLCITMFAAIKF